MRKYFLFIISIFLFSIFQAQSPPAKNSNEKNSHLVISKNKKKYGVINNTNKEVVIPFQYDKIISISNEGFALLHDKKWTVTDNKGSILSSDRFNKITVPKKSPQNEEKKIIAIGINLENINTTLFIKDHNQYYSQTYKRIIAISPYYYLVTQGDGKYGLITFRGEIVIPMEYQNITLMTNGKGESFAKITQESKFGCISLANGEIIIPVEWDNLGLLTDDTFWVEKEGSFNSGIINKKGGEVLAANQKRDFTVFSNQLIRVEEKDIKNVFYVSIDDPSFTREIIIPSLNPLTIKQEKSKYGVIDNRGNIIIPFEYDQIEKTDQGVFIVTKDLKNKLIDSTGKDVTDYYEKIIYNSVTDNFTAKFTNEKWGVINHKGTIMLENKFNSQEKLTKHLNKDLNTPEASKSITTTVKILTTTAQVILYGGFIILDLIFLNN